MADPKYAELPGIALDQPDTYETFSDHGQESEEESESETSETLHLSSLSWLGELEVGKGRGEDSGPETLTQKFSRLRCEVTELAEKLDAMAEASRESGSLVGLHKQVNQLKEQLEVCNAGVSLESGTSKTRNQDVSAQLVQFQSELAATGKEEQPPTSQSSFYELFLPAEKGGKLANSQQDVSVSDLDRRLARLESIIGQKSVDKLKVLSADTDGLSIMAAVKTLEERKAVQNQQHLAHVEGRIASLTNKLNVLHEQKKLVSTARASGKVAEICESLETQGSVAAILPDLIERLNDLEKLQCSAQGWNSRISYVEELQRETESYLAENEAELGRARDKLGANIASVADKVEKLQGELKLLAG